MFLKVSLSLSQAQSKVGDSTLNRERVLPDLRAVESTLGPRTIQWTRQCFLFLSVSSSNKKEAYRMVGFKINQGSPLIDEETETQKRSNLAILCWQRESQSQNPDVSPKTGLMQHLSSQAQIQAPGLLPFPNSCCLSQNSSCRKVLETTSQPVLRFRAATIASK